MKEFFAKLWKRISNNQSGFTLAELIVVVAIIVGLAAVILPNVGQFAGRGQEGANATERNSVQTAIDAWAATDGDLPLTATFRPTDDLPTDYFGPASDGVDHFIDLVTGSQAETPPGDTYLRLPDGGSFTDQFYCWDPNGTITIALTERGSETCTDLSS
ncbi:MAG: type II secretion system protein [Dehalococcoidia bacterium]